jgi:alcohol dehydrogenase (cytochrome c)
MRWLALVLLPATAVVAADGPAVFRSRCAGCHGGDGAGGEHAPGITTRLNSRTDAELRDLIRNGIPGAGMPGVELADEESRALVEHLRSLRPRGPAPVESPAAQFPGIVQNRGDGDLQILGRDGRIHLLRRNGDAWREVAGGVDWSTYNGQASGNRYSELTDITPGNVSGLRVAWMHTMAGAQRLETTPLVVGGVMYATNVNEVHALDAGTGRLIWQYRRARSKGLAGDAAGGINRGAGVAGKRLFLATDNAHLIALDRFTGALLWDTEMADSRANYGATSAPLVVSTQDGDLVVSGTSGGDEGVRGFVAAYRASDGKEAWRFWTVPARGEPESETWQGKALEHGCATTWLTGVYDAGLDLLYWTTGNPCPDYNGDERGGDNLYSNSVLALRPRTGERVWHFQYTPHDLHDWDAVQTPILLDAEWQGAPRKLLAQANRNGYFYLLDRTNGAFLRATPLVERLTWAKGIGSDGRPVMNAEAIPTVAGVTACPSVEGATNWFSPAYDARSGLFFVQTLEKCSVYRKAEGEWRAGQSFYNGSIATPPGDRGLKVLRAVDVKTGKVRWERRQAGGADS